MTPKLRRVLYDGQPNGDPFCTAPLPGGAGQGTATYNNGTSNVKWEWSAPGEITAGSTAFISVTTNTTLNGGWSAGIGISSPSEFGISPGTPSTEAIVPVGKPGSDGPKQVSYTFTPNGPSTPARRCTSPSASSAPGSSTSTWRASGSGGGHGLVGPREELAHARLVRLAVVAS